MLDILETVFYVVIFALFLTTFMPARIRRSVAESTGALWRMCGELLRALEPYAFKLVTGKEKPGASRDDRPNRTAAVRGARRGETAFRCGSTAARTGSFGSRCRRFAAADARGDRSGGAHDCT